MEITAPKEWYALLDIFEKEKRGIAIIIGATDAGKTTLANFLTLNLCRRGLKVALVDADIGQSTLGPPATIGFALFKSDPDWEVVLSPPEIFFAGSTTPEGHFPLFLKGVKRMVDKAFSYATDLVLVDTTGFVSGEAGRDLKRRKIDLISPRFILALQESDEIEHILTLYQENPLYKVLRLPLSEKVKPRSMEERRTNRASKFREYFKDSVIQELAIEQVRIEGEVLDPSGEVIPLDWSLRIHGLLLGLKDSNVDTLALGIIRNYLEEKKAVRISTPLRDIQSAKTIQLSSLKIIPVYEDEGF
jgi:polynucleotide 5'-hydroxyl-kinase GRC3/NOL9